MFPGPGRRVELLKEHIDYLKGILDIDWSANEDFDDIELHSKLENFDFDINNIEYSLPYDEIDEEDVPIEDIIDAIKNKKPSMMNSRIWLR